MRRLLGVALLSSVFLSAPVAWAADGVSPTPSVTATQNRTGTLTGDRLSLDYHRDSFTAQGNVVIKFEDIVLTTQEYHVDMAQKLLYIPVPFQITHQELQLSANSLEYYYAAQSGQADCPTIQQGRIFIQGKRVIIRPDKITISDAIFSTCGDAFQSSYSLHSSEVVIYPKDQKIIAYGNMLHLKNVPILPVPAYLYHMGSSENKMSPVPQIGSNEASGFFIDQRIPYFINPNLYGSLGVGYAQKFGWTFGAAATVGVRQWAPFNGKPQLTVDVQSTQLDGYNGLVEYVVDWMPPLASGPAELPIFLPTVPERAFKSQFFTRYSYRRLIDLWRVSEQPGVGYRFFNLPAFKDVYVSGAFMTRYLREFVVLSPSPLASSSEQSVRLEGTRTYRLSDNWDLNLGSEYHGNWYASQQWQRWWGTLGVIKAQGLIRPSVSYTKMLAQNGGSPFLFEQYNAIISDELGLGIRFRFNQIEVGAETHYNLSTNIPRDRDLLAKVFSDCWAFTLRWKTVQKDFLLEFELL